MFFYFLIMKGLISMNFIDNGKIRNEYPVVVYYNGNEDEWKFPALAIRDTTIEQGQRICQFEVCLSQKATVWQKIKHLFYSGIKIVEVDDLGNNNRSGFGSTGK